jgi:hypothetical protein
MSTTVQKVDPTGEQGPDDASIPVLTERLTLPPLELDTTLPLEAPDEPVVLGRPALSPSPVPSPVSAPSPVSVPSPVPVPLSVPGARPAAPASVSAAGSHWTRIELELRASILKDIAEQLPDEVDAIVRSRMGDAIDKLVAQFAAEARLALAASLRAIVEHAVHAELDRLRGRRR